MHSTLSSPSTGSLSYQERLEGMVNGFFERRAPDVMMLRQTMAAPDGRPVIEMYNNDYLSLGDDPRITARCRSALDAPSPDLMMSAVFHGEDDPQKRLERRFAGLTRAGGCLLFQSGYVANTGLLQAVADADTVVYPDTLAHGSIQDGIVAAGSGSVPFRHNDVGHLLRCVRKHGPGIIIVDSIYSTDGSVAPLEALADVAEEHGCILVVDESHSLGTHGPRGGGLVVELGLEDRVQFRTASLAKAFCGRAGLVLGAARHCEYLLYNSRTVVFSSALLPLELARFEVTLDLIEAEQWRRDRLHRNARRLREGIEALGFNTNGSASQIVSLEAGTVENMALAMAGLQRRGVLGAPFFPPATTRNRALLRLSVAAAHSREDIDAVVAACEALFDEVGVADWRSTRRKRAFHVPAPSHAATVEPVTARAGRGAACARGLCA